MSRSRESRTAGWVPLIIAIVGGIVTVTVAYFQVYVPNKLSIEATQTAEAKQALVAFETIPAPMPTLPSPILFQDFEDHNPTPGDRYSSDVYFMICTRIDDHVYEGKRAIRCEATGGKNGEIQKDHGGTVGVYRASSTPLDLSHAKAISVWILDTQGNNTVELKLRDYHNRISAGHFSSLPAVKNTWTEVTWILSDFKGVDMTGIDAIELYEWNDGAYYFDFVSCR